MGNNNSSIEEYEKHFPRFLFYWRCFLIICIFGAGFGAIGLTWYNYPYENQYTTFKLYHGIIIGAIFISLGIYTLIRFIYNENIKKNNGTE